MGDGLGRIHQCRYYYFERLAIASWHIVQSACSISLDAGDERSAHNALLAGHAT